MDILTVSSTPAAWKTKSTVTKLVKILKTLKLVPAKSKVVLSVSGTSEREMTELNWQYRRKKKPTDVLSFELGREPFIKGRFFLGDLVLCRPVVKKQAKQLKHSIQKEVAVLLTHGVLHLLGYDHEKSTRGAKKMADLEKKILKKLIKVDTGLIHRTSKLSELKE